MRCPHCGHTFEPNATAPGDWFACWSCGKGFAAPRTALPQPPQIGSAAHIVPWSRRAIEVGVVAVIIGALVAVLVVSVQMARTSAQRHSCVNNLKTVALAHHNYHDIFRALPAQAVLDEQGRPMHSWRLAFMPFVESSDRFDRYDFDVPWNNPNNLQIGAERIPAFVCPSHAGGDSNETSYFVVHDEATMFAPNRWLTFSEVPDGLANTIMVVESDTLHVAWTEPVDIPLETVRFRLDAPNVPGVSSGHSVVEVAMGDGSVRMVSKEIDVKTFRYALIRNDGTNVSLP